jgi:hypothetical protein
MAKEGPPPPPRRTSAAVAAFVAASLMTGAAEARDVQVVARECSKAQQEVAKIEGMYKKKQRECPQGRLTNETCRNHLWILASALHDAKNTERHRCTVASNRATRT